MSAPELVAFDDDELQAVCGCILALKKLEGSPAAKRVIRYVAERHLEKLEDKRKTIDELITEVRGLIEKEEKK